MSGRKDREKAVRNCREKRAFSTMEEAAVFWDTYPTRRQQPHRHGTPGREECITAGMELTQFGWDEGCLAFDPSDAAQAKLAIRVSGSKVKRVGGQRSIVTMKSGTQSLSWHESSGA
jgi:hypothetical protein